MKKCTLSQIVMFAGLIVTIAGWLIDCFITNVPLTAVAIGGIAAILAGCFVFAGNRVVVNVGYGLAAYCGVIGLVALLYVVPTPVVSSVGTIIMLGAAVIYLVTVLLNVFGFERIGHKRREEGDILVTLDRYKDLQNENILDEKEYEDLKNKALESVRPEQMTFAELKRWKKLLDRDVITAEEFAALKAKVLRPGDQG